MSAGLSKAQRTRYETEYLRVHSALTLLDMMMETYPPPEKVLDERQAFELQDLAARLEALTAPWAATQLMEYEKD